MVRADVQGVQFLVPSNTGICNSLVDDDASAGAQLEERTADSETLNVRFSIWRGDEPFGIERSVFTVNRPSLIAMEPSPVAGET